MKIGFPPGTSRKEKRPPLKNITINIPDCYDVAIQDLIEAKKVPSRSEAIRRALKDFIRSEISMINDLNNRILKS